MPTEIATQAGATEDAHEGDQEPPTVGVHGLLRRLTRVDADQ